MTAVQRLLFTQRGKQGAPATTALADAHTRSEPFNATGNVLRKQAQCQNREQVLGRFGCHVQNVEGLKVTFQQTACHAGGSRVAGRADQYNRAKDGFVFV